MPILLTDVQHKCCYNCGLNGKAKRELGPLTRKRLPGTACFHANSSHNFPVFVWQLWSSCGAGLHVRI
eukprot:5566789-Amphidinium_carterae.1